MARNETAAASAFLVCGLGRLGQYCAALLKEFGVKVSGIDQVEVQHWELPKLRERLDAVVVGDCREVEILEQAKIRECRAILLVTNDERVNVAAAFAARSLNPNVRLVLRSAQENLNALLSEHLGNFVAYEDTQLPAAAFALAALGDANQGFFNFESYLLRVVKETMQPSHRWCGCRQLYELNTASRQVLSHTLGNAPLHDAFYQWDPDASVREGDILTYIEATERLASESMPSTGRTQPLWRTLAPTLRWRNLKRTLQSVWQDSNQTQRAGILSSAIMLGLFLGGTALYKLTYPDASLFDALNLALVLVLGGFDNLFGGGLKLSFPIPWWLYLFSVTMTVTSTIFIGILYATLTEWILAARFQFMKRRPPVPKANHVVLIGFNRMGQQVADLIQALKQPLVGLGTVPLDPELLPQMPFVTGSMREALNRVNLSTAKSVVVVTDDEVVNLELGLMARTENPRCQLVIRTADPRFGDNVARLLPDARVLGTDALAAEAFVGAAFGENTLHLFHLNDRTILVTEYHIEAGDTLNDSLLAEIAYGYGVVPLFHQKDGHQFAKVTPSDDVRLHIGDHLIVLATIEGLQRVEQGKMLARSWLVRVEKAIVPGVVFEGATTLARISGCAIGTARTVMDQLPQTLPYPLYKHQALRLVRELSKVRVIGHLVAVDD